ncbi:WAT1-related protein At5g64700-like [Prosopis cineraria]|uniref:WAT1-related protein At5g64700-like n=1 Tax=Prosopis cineraria TaxID=364024 RepID=UPI00240F3E1E|nr:WAT1-related protein At5g64700-like [Prosopis cineraria]
MGGLKEWFMSSKVVMGMLMVQIFATGMQLLSRVILVQGTFIFSLIAYRHVVATLCVAPFAFYFERGHAKKLCWSVWFLVFLNSLVGIMMAMGFFYYGLRDTSATYSVNFLNLIPIITFLVSITFKMEKLGLKTWSGKAKAIGTIICVGGALTTSLYTGKEFNTGHHSRHTSHTASAEAPKAHMLRGTLFLVASCFSYAGWFIVQVKLLKVLPLKFWATMLTCMMASIQAAVIGLCIDSSKASWSLGWNMELITIVYSGALATGATFCLISWVVTLKGPTYPSMFNPLALIFVAFSEAILLGEPLKVGTLVGMVLIIAGLYCFLWGKTRETRSLAHSNEAAVEVCTVMPADSVGLQLAARVVSSSSSNNAVIDIENSHAIKNNLDS